MSFECPVCFLEGPADEFITNAGCGHFCCTACVRCLAIHFLDEGKHTVPCFKHDCPLLVPHDVFSKLLDDDQLRKLQQLERDASSPLDHSVGVDYDKGNKNIKKCPSCKRLVEHVDGDFLMGCVCGEFFCFQCLKKIPQHDRRDHFANGRCNEHETSAEHH